MGLKRCFAGEVRAELGFAATTRHSRDPAFLQSSFSPVRLSASFRELLRSSCGENIITAQLVVSSQGQALGKRLLGHIC